MPAMCVAAGRQKQKNDENFEENFVSSEKVRNIVVEKWTNYLDWLLSGWKTVRNFSQAMGGIQAPRRAQSSFWSQKMDLETENKILLTIINFLKRFNYED